MNPTTFEHLNEHELRTARQLIKADKFVIEKCPKVKDNPKTKTPVKAKRTSEINCYEQKCVTILALITKIMTNLKQQI